MADATTTTTTTTTAAPAAGAPAAATTTVKKTTIFEDAETDAEQFAMIEGKSLIGFWTMDWRAVLIIFTAGIVVDHLIRWVF